MKVKIGLVQMGMSPDKFRNVDKAVRGIRDAAGKGANIVCLPELFTSPYFPQEERTSAKRYAEAVPGETTDALSEAAEANGVVVVGGSLFERDGEKLFNTTPVFDEKGKLLGKYRKMHVPHDPSFYEQNYFERGDLGYKVFETRYGKLGTLICYDQWFPEAARILALMGADIIFYPTAIGLVDGVGQAEGDWQNAWTTVQAGHAIANGVAVAAVNRVGREGRMRFWGGSFVSSQFGTVLAKGGDKEEIVLAEIDTSLGRDVKEGWRFFYNRRPDTYRKLVEK
jgi:agmatine deiminase